MRPGSHKPDSITCLFVFVVLGLLMTTIVKADDYLFGSDRQWQGVLTESSTPSFRHAQEMAMPGRHKNGWLLPGGVSTAFEGGMAHFRIDSQRNGRVSGMLPENTRFVFSMGVEENERQLQLERQSATPAADWYDRYEPTLYLTIGHSW